MVLEIGTGLGVSTRALARYAHFVMTVDIDLWVQATIFPQLQKGNDRLQCMHSRPYSASIIPDLVFIDGDHSSEAVRGDIEYARQAVRGGGLIVLHDAKSLRVREAILELLPERMDLETEHGLCVAVKR